MSNANKNCILRAEREKAKSPMHCLSLSWCSQGHQVLQRRKGRYPPRASTFSQRPTVTPSVQKVRLICTDSDTIWILLKSLPYAHYSTTNSLDSTTNTDAKLVPTANFDQDHHHSSSTGPPSTRDHAQRRRRIFRHRRYSHCPVRACMMPQTSSYGDTMPRKVNTLT
jgi:hypothetical protein